MDNQRAGLEIFRMKGIIPLLPDITVVAIMCVLVLVQLVDVVGIVLPNAGPIVLVQHTCANVEGEPRKITIRCIACLLYTSPVVGVMTLTRLLMVVDFPAPLWPISPTICPSSMVRSKWLRAMCPCLLYTSFHYSNQERKVNK